MILLISFSGLLLFGSLVAPAGTVLPLSRQVNLTFYCRCSVCCGEWSGGPTASGKMPKVGRTLAAPRSVPFGTKVWVDGFGWRIVEDRTRSGKGWDLYVGSHKEAVKAGVQSKKIIIQR